MGFERCRYGKIENGKIYGLGFNEYKVGEESSFRVQPAIKRPKRTCRHEIAGTPFSICQNCSSSIPSATPELTSGTKYLMGQYGAGVSPTSEIFSGPHARPNLRR